MRIYFVILSVLYSISIHAQSDIYIHGTYQDVDWETLEFVGPHASVSEKIYYNYPESRTGKIKLRKESAYKSRGIYYYTVRFPNVSTVYHITLNPDEQICVMRDTEGKYYKEFYKKAYGEQNNEVDVHPQQSLIRQVKRYILQSSEYVSNAECNKTLEQGGYDTEQEEMTFSLYDENMKFVFGDLNGDNQLDAIMRANITQCDGGNSCCLCVDYIVALSQYNGKHIITSFDFPNYGSGSTYVPLRIEKNGSVYTKEFFKINDDECRCCTSGERYDNYRFSGTRIYKER